jgi:hypothetical protein
MSYGHILLFYKRVQTPSQGFNFHHYIWKVGKKYTPPKNWLILGVNLLQGTNNKIQRLQNTLSMAKITKYCSNYERNTILKQMHMLVENTRNLLVLLISYQYDFQSIIQSECWIYCTQCSDWLFSGMSSKIVLSRFTTASPGRNTILKQMHMLVENTRNLLVLLISYQYDFQSMINQFFGGVYFFPTFQI